MEGHFKLCLHSVLHVQISKQNILKFFLSFPRKKIKIKINKSDFCLIICYICFINFLTPKLGGSEVKLADMSKKQREN